MALDISDQFDDEDPGSKIEWDPDYVKLFMWRQKQRRRMKSDKKLFVAAKVYYRDHPIEFINDWVDTYDPRNAGLEDEGKMTRMPLIMFPIQEDLVNFILACLKGEENGLIEKCRDMGATWVCVAISVWLWLFWPGISIGWGSRKEALVDKIGILDSIFEKIRMVIRGLPPEFLPKGFSFKDHMPFMRIINPETDATIVGEGGNNIGRGGRTRIYFKDESAHYEQPEAIASALGDNTRVQIDISSVNGLGNLFHRTREAGTLWTKGEAHKGTNVLIMDWRDHPLKDQKWYDKRKAEDTAKGILHIFKQEIDRDYGSNVEGIIIPSEWVTAAIDAHIKLEFEATGQLVAGLDVGDGGGDMDAISTIKGSVVQFSEAWPNLNDTGASARKAIEILKPGEDVELQYDSVGVGSGVKSEANRLAALHEDDPDKLPEHIRFVNWSAGAGPLNPDDPIFPPSDTRDKPPLNKDFYGNLKAQAWWELRLRFERTFNAVTAGVYYSPEKLISLPSDLPYLQQLRKELSQAVMKKSTGHLKLIVDKNPAGTKSPNQADSLVMATWPIPDETFTAKVWL